MRDAGREQRKGMLTALPSRADSWRVRIAVLAMILFACLTTISSYAGQRSSVNSFLTSSAFGGLYLGAQPASYPRVNGFVVRTTNAVPSSTEAAMWNSMLRPEPRVPSASSLGEIALRDAHSRIIAIIQGPKVWGGVREVLTRYSGFGSDIIPQTDLSSLRIAGLKIGDSAYALYLHLGEPYSIARLIADRKLAPARRHVLGHPSWFMTDLGDGVYNYTGAVPNKAQSCVTLYQVVIKRRHIDAIIASTEC